MFGPLSSHGYVLICLTPPGHPTHTDLIIELSVAVHIECIEHVGRLEILRVELEDLREFSLVNRLRGSKEQGRTLLPRQSVSGITSQTSVGSFPLEWTNEFFIAQLRYPGAVQAKGNRCGWPKPHPEQKS